MYKNVGKKISGLAKLLCILGIISSIVGGISFGMGYFEVNRPVAAESVVLPDGTEIIPENAMVETKPSSPVAHILGALLIAVSGSFSAWIGSLTIYGVGHLITKTSENNQLIKLLAENRVSE